MPESNSELPRALVPEYTCEVNQPVTLYKGVGVLETQNGEIPGNCVIRYSWNPTGGPEVVFCPFAFAPGLFQSSLQNSERFLRVPSIGLRASLLARRTHLGQDISLIGILERDVRMGSPSGFSRVSFHLGNFQTVMGATFARGNGWTRGGIHLEDGPWVIDIDPIPQHGTNQAFSQRLNDECGFGITHVGSVTRLDGNVFDVEAVDAVLAEVGRTICFARASQSYPILRSGYSLKGERVWRCWSGFHTDAWDSNTTWFSSHRPEILQEVFTGWRRLSGNENEEIIHAALGLYLDAHTPGLTSESRLILLQAALEGLATGWPFPPLPGSPAITGFNSGAARRIAEIAVSLGLPLQVPSALSELISLQHPLPNSPGLEKMAWVRNSIAHLGNYPRLAGHSNVVRYEAYQLAAWHLELALLRLLSVNGFYQNRVTIQWAGEVQQVPWFIQTNTSIQQ